MAKKDRFPDSCSGGYPFTFESEESGGSKRACRKISGCDHSSNPRTKRIKMSSVSGDGFSVPIRDIALSGLSAPERKNLVLRLRSELDQIRAFQKKIDSERSRLVAVSSSNDILSCSNVEPGIKASNVRRSSVSAFGGGKRLDPSGQETRASSKSVSGKSEHANEVSPLGVSNALLMKQCESLLKKLMSHEYGWVFNEPVDVVKLNIPDYLEIIKNPMDLGTVKKKIASRRYTSPLEFLSDVRLTFSNAMTYNPRSNDVHIMAEVLSTFFELRWKVIERKLPVIGSERMPVQEKVETVEKLVPPTKKKKLTSAQHNVLSEPVKRVMTHEEKSKISRDLVANVEDLSDDIIDFLRQQSSNGAEDEIELDIDNLSDDTLFTLRKLLDDHLQGKLNHEKEEPCVIELLNESGVSSSTVKLCEGNETVDENVDIGGNESPVSSYPPVEIERDTGERNDKKTSSGSSSDYSSENELDYVKASSPLNLAKIQEMNLAGHVLDKKADVGMLESQSEIRLDQLQQNSQQMQCGVESDSRKDTGESAPNEGLDSTGKLYRAALLKSRFADTILKAQEKTINQGKNGDPEKLRREKEELENQKRKEKARLQAEAKAAEDARRRAEAEATKRKIDLEREAARQALLKMEKTVEIDEASRFLKDLEMLTGHPEQLPSSANETSPDHHFEDGVGRIKFGVSNPLEQLGLYMRMDEEEEEGEPPSCVLNGDLEEGEI